jgi:hypothetical protein
MKFQTEALPGRAVAHRSHAFVAVESRWAAKRLQLRTIFNPVWTLVICAALAVSATAQLPLSDDDTRIIAPLFDKHSRDSIKCVISLWQPAIDFAFRFVIGYDVRCPLRLFEGKKATIINYLRVTPRERAPSLFGSAYHLPEIAPETLRSMGGSLHKLKDEFGMSGAFYVGEGDYSIEVLVIDGSSRTCRRRWNVRARPRRSQRGMQLAIQPSTVAPLDRAAWQLTPPQARGGLRLTVLLDAAPINPYQSRLYAWDRIFLLECIYSLLRQTPYKSVRLVAFNLDQQREIFRNEGLDNTDFLSLSRALREMETASVSVQALKKRNSPEFLATLVNRELGEEGSDAIVFIGPNSHLDVQMNSGLLTGKTPASPPVFYLEYYPWVGAAFPDSIQRLVKTADGRTFQIHTPAELDQAIQKMLALLRQE